jgi:hypothetical protein
VFFVQYYYGDEIKGDVRGGTSNMHEGDKNPYKIVVHETL